MVYVPLVTCTVGYIYNLTGQGVLFDCVDVSVCLLCGMFNVCCMLHRFSFFSVCSHINACILSRDL